MELGNYLYCVDIEHKCCLVRGWANLKMTYVGCFVLCSVVSCFFVGSITHYRRTYTNFRSGKAQGAKGETDQFHVEPTMPPVDEKLLDSETFVSMTGSMSKVIYTLVFPSFCT